MEKQEISRLPEKYRPVGAWGYFGYAILFNIPLIGFICLLVFSISGSNINRRSYARSFFCIYIIAAVLIGIAVVICIVSGVPLLDMIKEWFAQFTQAQ